MYNISNIENKMEANGVYLLNPLLCMNQTYLESVLKKPYNKAKIYITRQYGQSFINDGLDYAKTTRFGLKPCEY